MNKKLNIAIYSGSIPSTTFIENLIEGVSKKYDVILFGKLKTKPVYSSKNIKCYPTYSNFLKNIIITAWRTIKLLLIFTKRFMILWNQIKPLKGIYNKYNWWVRYVPVLLKLPDIFHVQWAKDIENWLFLKEHFNCKIVLSLRGAHINYSPISNSQLAKTYKKYFPKVDAFHAVSKAIGVEAQKYGANQKKIRTIHSLISETTFDLFKQPKELKSDKLQFISVGRYHWKKGYNLALDACALLKERGILFSYTIVAAGKIPEDLLFQRNQLNLNKEVVFISSLPQKEVFFKMQESDVLLLPSFEEGIANVVLEAMAIGVPVVSTNCGGMEEVIIPNKTGWLVPTYDAEAIVKALIEVSTISLDRKKDIVTNAYQLVKEQFNSEIVIEEFNEFYEGVYYSE